MEGTTCYLSQYANAIYVLNADKANPSSVYIYDATAKSWSVQSIDTSSGFDPTNFATILDHDTNVFYAYSKGSIYALDMGLLKKANSTALAWIDVQSPDLDTTPNAAPDVAKVPGRNTQGYEPTLALARNHVHFLGVPGLKDGSDKIFIIHYSYMQPAPQSYSPAFPNTHGKTASFFLSSTISAPQKEYAFIPDDGSSTYVINAERNTTKVLAGPPSEDKLGVLSASMTALVRVGSDGKVVWMAYDPSSSSSSSSWNTLDKLPSFLVATEQTSTGKATRTPGTGTLKATGTGLGGVAASGSPVQDRTSGALREGEGVKMILGVGVALVWSVVATFGLGI